MYFEDLWLKSRKILKIMATYGVWPSFSEIHELGGNKVCLKWKSTVRKFPKLKVAVWPSFPETRENPENGPFWQPKKCFLFSSVELILVGDICQKTASAHSVWSIWAPRAPFVTYTPMESPLYARFPYPENKEI